MPCQRTSWSPRVVEAVRLAGRRRSNREPELQMVVLKILNCEMYAPI